MALRALSVHTERSLKEQIETLYHLTVFGRNELIFFEEPFQNVSVVQSVAFSHKDLPS